MSYSCADAWEDLIEILHREGVIDGESLPDDHPAEQADIVLPAVQDLTKARLTKQELATVLAALRFYQESGQGDPANRTDDIHAIATCNDEEVSLDDAGIDDLCERLNV